MAGMPWEAQVVLSTALLVISGGMICARTYKEIRRHLRSYCSACSIVLVTLAWLLCLTTFACSLWRGRQKVKAAVDGNLGAVLWNPFGVADECKVAVLKTIVVELIVAPTSIWMVKASVLALFHSVSDRIAQRALWLLRALGVLCLISWIAIVVIYSFACRPFRSQWATDPDHFCTPAVQMRAQVLTMILDNTLNILIVAFAFKIFGISSIPPRDKRNLACILFLVLMCAFASVSRVVVITLEPLLNIKSDSVHLMTFLTKFETNCAIAASSWPSIRGMLDTALFTTDVTLCGDGRTDFAKQLRRKETGLAALKPDAQPGDVDPLYAMAMSNSGIGRPNSHRSEKDDSDIVFVGTIPIEPNRTPATSFSHGS